MEITPVKVLIEDAAGYADPQAEDALVYRVCLNFYDGRRLPGVDGVKSAARLTNDPAVKVWAASKGSEHPGHLQGPPGRQVLKAWINPRLYTGPCQEGIQGIQTPPETPIPADAIPVALPVSTPQSPATAPGEADMPRARRVAMTDQFELGTADYIFEFDVHDLDEILLQFEAIPTTFPASCTVTLEAQLGGVIWYDMPGGAITFSANTLSNHINVRDLSKVRLRVTDNAASAVMARVIFSGSADP